MARKVQKKLAKPKRDVQLKRRASDSGQKVERLSPAHLEKLVKIAGLNPALPCLALDMEGNLLAFNRRMATLLGPTLSAPLKINELARVWPFFDAERSGEALLKSILGGPKTAKLRKFNCEARLKNFRLYESCIREGVRARDQQFRVILAELQRPGDLIADEPSRQALFRSLSHEIRTSVHALKGYVHILEGEAIEMNSPLQPLIKRLDPTLSRLDKVVERLDEFRMELELSSPLTPSNKKVKK